MKMLNWIVLGLIGVLLSACSSAPRMEFVNQNLDQDRLVGEAAVSSEDVLNQYSHGYPPSSNTITVHSDFDRPSILSSGDQIYAQIGLVPKAPVDRPINLHVLVFDENADKHAKLIQDFLASVQQAAAVMKPSSLTVDTSVENPSFSGHVSFLQKRYDKFFEMMKAMTQMKYSGEPEHVIVLLGDLTRDDKHGRQNLVDMAGLLLAKGVSMSIYSYAEKPDFSFLEALTRKGKGQLQIHNEFVDTTNWVTNDIRKTNAVVYRELDINIELGEHVVSADVVSPSLVGSERKSSNALAASSNKRIQYKLPTLTEGEEFVALLRVYMADGASNELAKVFVVKVVFLNPTTGRYEQLYHVATLNYSYSDDRNESIPFDKGRVARSRLILDTQSVIADAGKLVRDKRNFQAIALVEEQRNRLKKFPTKTRDTELYRDERILEKFSEKLYAFDDKSFQGVRSYWDLQVDSDRFVERYK